MCIRKRLNGVEGTSRRHGGLRRLSILLGAVILAGCAASVPVEQVRLYTETFSQASDAGNKLYDQVSDRVTLVQQRENDKKPLSSAGSTAPATSKTSALTESAICPTVPEPAPPYKTCFSPSDFLSGGHAGEHPGIQARRLALATITQFNAVAARLASGETADAMRVQVERLGSTATAFAAISGAGVAPLIGITSDLVGKVAAWGEQLRAGQELRSAIAQGAPLIRKLLDLLVEDARLMYAFRRNAVQEETLIKAKSAAQKASIPIKSAVKANKPYPTLSQDSERYTTARSRIHGFPFEALTDLAGTTGTGTIGAAEVTKIGSELDRLEAEAERYSLGVEVLKNYYDALGAYVELLSRSGDALDELVAAASSPTTVTIDVAKVTETITDIRQKAKEVDKLLDQ